MEVKGQSAIVTGSGSGLGAATARALAAAGARVALLDVNLAGIEEVAAEIGGLAIPCDVSDATSVEAAVETARQTHGPARIAVSCAGVATAGAIVGRGGPLPLEDFARVVDINLIGTFNLLRLAAAGMVKLDVLPTGERGVIINTGSIAAFEGQIGQTAYAASKGAVVAMTLPAARELARFGIRVLTINPGLFGTPMVLDMPEEIKDSLLATPPFPKRFGDPSEYAKLALHMIDNVMLNGESVRIDAAMRMQPK